MRAIDIDSIILHDSYALNKSCNVQIIYIDRYKPEELANYNIFVVISGYYKDGTLFKKLKCRVSLSNYLFYKKKYYLTDYTKN